MIECVNGEGQGCCDICLHMIGWHRYWSSHLYYIRNKNGLYLRVKSGYGSIFSANETLAEAAFCYKHAKEVEASRKCLADWELEA